MTDNILIYFNPISGCTLAICCVEINIKINWIAIKCIPFPLNYFPSYSSLFQFLIILCGESPESLQISFPAWFASTPRQLSSSANRLLSKSGRKWETVDQIPIVSLVRVGWREKPLKSEIFLKAVNKVKKKSRYLFESLQNGFDTEPSHCDHQS